MTGAGLADPYRVRLGEQTTQVIRGAQTTGGRIFYRDGVTSQITPVGRTLSGPGIWLQAGMATRLDATVGSRVSFSISGEGQARRVPGGRDLPQPGPGAVRPYWCSYTNLFQNPSYGNDSTPPPLVIATDAATFQAVRDSYGGSSTDSWVSPAKTTDITLTQGRAIADKQAAAYAAAGVTPSAAAGRPQLRHRADARVRRAHRR